MLAIAEKQFGLVTRRQLIDMGFSASAVDRRIAAGLLRRVQAGVYAVGGGPETFEQRALAPVLGTRRLAAVSHGAAARLLGIRGFDRHRKVTITVERAAHPRAPKVSVRRSEIFAPVDVRRTASGIPTTRPERTVIGCAADQSSTAARAIDSAILAGLTTYDHLWTYLTRYSGPGCPGSAAVRAALIRRDPRERPAESSLEVAWVEALAAHGVVGLVKQHPVRTEDGVLRIDLADPHRRVGIEFDSRLWHSSEEDYRRERRKRYLLGRAGYLILPVTELDLRERVPEVAADVLSVLHGIAPAVA